MKYIKYANLHKTYIGKVLNTHYYSRIDSSEDLLKIEFIEDVSFIELVGGRPQTYLNGEKSFLYRRRLNKITEEEYLVALVIES